MKFALMMHARKGSMTGFSEAGEWNIFKWPEAAMKKHMEHHRELTAELEKNGELVRLDALTAPDEARLVRSGGKGKVFPETKEFLAGWWLVDVASAERAYEIAARASASPGPDGQPLNMEIEVRRVMG
jgi:hypothetical protein